MTWLDHFACALVDQAAIQSAPDETAVLRAHLEAVLRIVGRGEYRSQEDQAVIKAAKAAIAAATGRDAQR